MEQPKQSHWSSKLGYITGPVFILLGLFLKTQNHTMWGFFVGFGIFRVILSAFVMYKAKQRNEQRNNIGDNLPDTNPQD